MYSEKLGAETATADISSVRKEAAHIFRSASKNQEWAPLNFSHVSPHEARVRPTTSCSSRDTARTSQLARKHMYLQRAAETGSETSTLERLQKLNTEESSTLNKVMENSGQRGADCGERRMRMSSSPAGLAKDLGEYGLS